MTFWFCCRHSWYLQYFLERMFDFFGNLITFFVGENFNCHKKFKKEIFWKNKSPIKQKPKPTGASHYCCDVKGLSSSFCKTLSHWSLGKGSWQQFLKIVLVLGHIFLEVPLLWILQRNTPLTLLSVVIKSLLTRDKYSLSEALKTGEISGKLVKIIWS